MTFIYALMHPESEEPYYVGQTDNPGQRILQHFSIEPRLKTLDIIAETGRYPLFIILAAYEGEDARLVEAAWMNHFADAGYQMDNAQWRNTRFLSDHDDYKICFMWIDGKYYERDSVVCTPMNKQEYEEGLEDVKRAYGLLRPIRRGQHIDKSAGDNVSKKLDSRYST